jgi:hypothetical protein
LQNASIYPFDVVAGQQAFWNDERLDVAPSRRQRGLRTVLLIDGATCVATGNLMVGAAAGSLVLSTVFQSSNAACNRPFPQIDFHIGIWHQAQAEARAPSHRVVPLQFLQYAPEPGQRRRLPE